jgi:hypothetical protein
MDEEQLAAFVKQAQNHETELATTCPYAQGM